jgi:SAM-dependent methyltransferase
MTAMTLAGFEARYRADPDPWSYQSSQYERDKYAATLAACGPGPFSSALELGSSIGVFSRQLAPRCERLTTIDGAPTAVAAARSRLAGCDHVDAIVGTIPEDVPRRSYDLVVSSEILYYLSREALGATLAMLAHVLEPGGRLIAVHWRPDGPERPLTAAQVHAELRAQPWLAPRDRRVTDDYLLDALERT